MRWLVWSIYIVLLTAALVTPYPAHAAHSVFPDPDEQFTAAKTVHITMYALFAIMSGWVRIAASRRWLLLVVMSVHACLTEFVQTYVPERYGTWQDVAINHCGLYLGLILSWRWWSESPAVARREDNSP
jgi:VanZ family protein